MRPDRNNDRGALTLLALCLTAVIGIALGSYIALCYQSLSHSSRQFNLNRARQLAETGVEEALWALNNNDWASASWGAAVDADADSATDDHQKTFTGYTFDAGVSGQVVVKVLNYAGSTPTIIATATITAVASGTFTKTLTATTKQAPLFTNAIGIIDGSSGRALFNSSGLVDSWNSDPDGDYNVSTPKVDYTTPTYASASSCAATVAAPNITLNSATVYGYAATFGNSIVTTGSSKIKGPGPTVPNIDTTRIGKSAFVPSFAVAAPSSYAPYGTLTSFSTGTVAIGTSGTTRYYDTSYDFTVSGSGVVLRIDGPVVIIVPHDFVLQSGAKVQVTSTGRLELIVGNSITVGAIASSTSKFQNDTNEAKNLAVYSTDTGSRTFIYRSGESFCGVIYSASTTSKIEFTDIDSSASINGAILANSNVEFDAGTNPQIHYDLALQTLPKGWFKGVTTPYLVLQLTES